MRPDSLVTALDRSLLLGAGLPLVLAIVFVADRKGAFRHDAFSSPSRKRAALLLLVLVLIATTLLPAAAGGAPRTSRRSASSRCLPCRPFSRASFSAGGCSAEGRRCAPFSGSTRSALSRRRAPASRWASSAGR